MKFIELVRKRRSTRKYLQKALPREIIDQCLEAAHLAPSACNAQPWYFIVVDDEKVKNELADIAFSGIYATNTFAKKAPVLIVVLTNQSNYIAKMGSFFRNIKYSLIDIGIACDHLTLQAEELGVGTCWLGWFNEKGVKKFLNLPKSTKIDVMIGMGYPEKVFEKKKKRKSLEEIRQFYSEND
jgi:nitroreductase